MSNINVAKVTPSVGVKFPSYTNANRPAGEVGLMIYNETFKVIQVYNGTTWVNVGTPSAFTASGGSSTQTFGSYKIHTFTSSGTFSTTADGTVDILIIGGGGGGGAAAGNCSNGGGGAGGLVYKANHSITSGVYSVVVGLGGNGAPGGTAISGTPGGNSSVFGFSAIGGGSGGGGGGYNAGSGQSGGSGGGGSHPFSGTVGTGTQPAQTNSGTQQFGNPGGVGNNSAPEWGGGGGGGSGAQGEAGSAPSGGRGGIGLIYDIQGTPFYYAGGGAGANCGNPFCTWVTGGLGGGAPAWCGVGSRGGDGFGGGGGGGGYGGGGRNPYAPPGANSGGRGGDGIVVIRYGNQTSDPTIGQASSNPAINALQILANNPSSSNGLYWIRPAAYGGSAQQIYCDMTGGGWMLVSSSNASDSTIPGGTGRNSTSYYLNRAGALGTPNPNSDYIIGSLVENLSYQQVRVFAFGRGSTNGTTTWTAPGTYINCEWYTYSSGAARLIDILPRSVVSISGNSSLSSSANFFIMDGIQIDNVRGGFNANANQTTLGGVGVQGIDGDTSSGCYLGHGNNEGSFEGWYDAGNSSADCQGYTTWVK